MKVLVIGDVHGCYYTLRALVEKNWDPESETLIQLGDLINKGSHSGLCIKYWMELEKLFPGKIVLLRGNHEQMLLDQLNSEIKDEVQIKLIANILHAGLKIKKVQKWLSAKKLKWENKHILITHAGINKTIEDPFDITSPLGILHNKGGLKPLDKLQVVGHAMVKGGKPVFSPRENAWFLDTGAWTKKYLSALRISEDASEVKVIREPRSEMD